MNSIIKCKMCGGDLNIQPGEKLAECMYCGSMQTIPNIDDERRANLYARAGQFRLNGDFDKAASIYDEILRDDNRDAEAHWSIVLCKYGIDYVQDPKTRRRIPTVNRMQYTSIFDDPDYQETLKYADLQQRQIYEYEAQMINSIQRGILEISRKEEPFDIFISYKETDSLGRRTQDSVYAYDIYERLTQEGYRVFFSRVTLECVVGTAYEPYIFAALNSAKVMIVVGTSAENMNAVWVRNEWSRFLLLMQQDKSRSLIPVYKDMNPYDLPAELVYLQAQDMNRLGFIQDLVRGIGKIVSYSSQQQYLTNELNISTEGTGTETNRYNGNSIPRRKRKTRMRTIAVVVVFFPLLTFIFIYLVGIKRFNSNDLNNVTINNSSLDEIYEGNKEIDPLDSGIGDNIQKDTISPEIRDVTLDIEDYRKNMEIAINNDSKSGVATQKSLSTVKRGSSIYVHIKVNDERLKNVKFRVAVTMPSRLDDDAADIKCESAGLFYSYGIKFISSSEPGIAHVSIYLAETGELIESKELNVE